MQCARNRKNMQETTRKFKIKKNILIFYTILPLFLACFTFTKLNMCSYRSHNPFCRDDDTPTYVGAEFNCSERRKFARRCFHASNDSSIRPALDILKGWKSVKLKKLNNSNWKIISKNLIKNDQKLLTLYLNQA